MKIYAEKKLNDFEFWGGAVSTVKYLTDDELEIIEDILEDCEPYGMEETDINDLFWHDCDTIANWLGYENFSEIMKQREDDGWFE